MSTSNHQYKLAFYGDDFTGSTDALDFLGRAGVPTILFMDPPDRELLAEFPDIEAFGVAGMTRTMDPVCMRAALSSAFKELREHNPEIVHYKVCSTFDSSPTVGNIGTAIETGKDVFSTPSVPLLVGNPELGRFSVFGNLFARMGTHDAGKIYRIDQHPSMSRHPVTPSTDGDLRDHLARQTDQKMALLDILALERPVEECHRVLEEILRDNPEVLFFDILEAGHLAKVGSLIEGMRQPGIPLFTVGSSGIEAALCRFWDTPDTLRQPTSSRMPTDAGPLLVASGSCSPVTGEQIKIALSGGFREIALDVDLLFGESSTSYIEAIGVEATRLLTLGESVILHTSSGPDDPRISNRSPSASGQAGSAEIIGKALGEIVLQAISTHPVKRICFAGGDTSSHAARALKIKAVEMISPVQPGAPLCRAHSSLEKVHGLEVNFKGGQVGPPDYFPFLRNGLSTTEEQL